jgi:hypothetical protein
MKRYDLRGSHYGVNPAAFMRDTLDRITAEMAPGEEALVSINPERFSEDPSMLIPVAPRRGVELLSSVKLAPNQVDMLLRKPA